MIKTNKFAGFLAVMMVSVPMLMASTEAFAATASQAPNVSKATFLYNLWSISNANVPPLTSSPYKDAPIGTWQWNTIQTAIQYGMLSPDSKTHFGVNDPITLQEASSILQSWINFSLPSTMTPLAWMQAKGVLPAGKPTATLSLAQDLQTMNVLKQLYSGNFDYLPSSWNMTATEAGNLIRGMNRLTILPYAQEQSKENTTLTLVPSAKGAKNAQITSALSQLDLSRNVVTSIQIATPSTKNNESLTSVIVTENGQQVQNDQVYQLGAAEYANQGSGWQQLPSAFTTFATPTSNFQSSDFAKMTIKATSNGLSSYQGVLDFSNPAFLSTMVDQFASDAGLTLTKSQKLALGKVIAKEAKSNVAYKVELDATHLPLVRTVQTTFQLVLPPSVIPIGSKAQQTQFNADVKSIDYSYTLSQQFAFAPKSIPVPAGLLGNSKS